MFPQLGSPLIAVTPVNRIVRSERHCTPVSCSAVHSCAAWLQSCGSPGRLAVHACERMLLFMVLRLCRPTKSQLRLPCQLISIILLTIRSSFIRLLIHEQLRLPCRLLVLLLIISSSIIILLIDEQLRLPCRLISIFIVASDATPTLLWDYAAMKGVWDHTRSFLWGHADFDCGIMPTLLAASLPTRFVVS
jgi:hypothetical protein